MSEKKEKESAASRVIKKSRKTQKSAEKVLVQLAKSVEVLQKKLNKALEDVNDD